MSELATAAFAAHTDAHLLDAPRSSRFASFRATFDEAGFLGDLAARGYRWLPRSDRSFPVRLRSIHDPPPGLFVRGEAPFALLDRPSVDWSTRVATVPSFELEVMITSSIASGVGAGPDGLNICGASQFIRPSRGSIASRRNEVTNRALDSESSWKGIR